MDKAVSGKVDEARRQPVEEVTMALLVAMDTPSAD